MHVYRPLGDAKPMTVKREDDLYEMAIQFKKDEDFAGWYTDVSNIRKRNTDMVRF